MARREARGVRAQGVGHTGLSQRTQKGLKGCPCDAARPEEHRLPTQEPADGRLNADLTGAAVEDDRDAASQL
jgi:hypothetical protein